MGTIAQIFESGEHSAKKGLFNNLVMLARVDGKVDESELKLLSRIAKKLSLTPEQVTEILENPDDYPMIPPVSRLERCERFIQFIEMTNVDGHIDPIEERLINKYGIALGFTQKEVDEVEPIVIDNVKAKKDAEEIIAMIL